MTFLQILLPIFLIFSIGFIGQTFLKFDPKMLSKMAIYLLSPFLVFRTFYETNISFSYSYMILYTIGLCASIIIILYVIGFFLKYTEKEICSLILSSAFMNNGNYGTPVVLFVFGTTGMNYAVILMVFQQLLMGTVGVYYAAKGSEKHSGVKSSLRAITRMPLVYGAMFGIVFQLAELELGENIEKAVYMVADAAIPTIMIILGAQLATISLKEIPFLKISIALGTRMILSPLIAYFIVFMLPVDEILKQIMVLMAAMPTAANTTMLAIEFQTDPEFVSSATLITTLSSLITLPFVMYGITFLF